MWPAPKAFIAESRRQLQALKQGNEHLVVHIEYVPATRART